MKKKKRTTTLREYPAITAQEILLTKIIADNGEDISSDY